MEEEEEEVPLNIAFDDEPPTSQEQTTNYREKPILPHEPPYPERLNVSKPVEPLKYDPLDELKNVNIRIPLLQALKDIPIYAK